MCDLNFRERHEDKSRQIAKYPANIIMRVVTALTGKPILAKIQSSPRIRSVSARSDNFGKPLLWSSRSYASFGLQRSWYSEALHCRLAVNTLTTMALSVRLLGPLFRQQKNAAPSFLCTSTSSIDIDCCNAIGCAKSRLVRAADAGIFDELNKLLQDKNGGHNIPGFPPKGAPPPTPAAAGKKCFAVFDDFRPDFSAGTCISHPVL